jgi:hypothetical protein
VFTARYALGPYIKQIRFVLKGLTSPFLYSLWIIRNVKPQKYPSARNISEFTERTILKVVRCWVSLESSVSLTKNSFAQRTQREWKETLSPKSDKGLNQAYKNSGRLVARVSQFSTATPNNVSRIIALFLLT